jgi:hypothetical protein
MNPDPYSGKIRQALVSLKLSYDESGATPFPPLLGEPLGSLDNPLFPFPDRLSSVFFALSEKANS